MRFTLTRNPEAAVQLQLNDGFVTLTQMEHGGEIVLDVNELVTAIRWADEANAGPRRPWS